MKHYLTVAIVTLVMMVTFPALARDRQRNGDVRTRVDRVELIDYGIYRTEVSRTVDAPESVSGTASAISRRKTELVSQTERIPATLGTLFGFRYAVVGEPRNRKVPLRLTLLLPDTPGGKNADNADRRISHTLTPPISKTDFVGFGFQTEQESIPGIWTFQLFFEDRLMAEKRFTVYVPR